MNQDSKNVEPEENRAQLRDNSTLTPLITTEGTPYQITEEGSLGILALGYVGIMLWRDKKYNSSAKSERET